MDARRFSVSKVQGFRGGHSSPSETEVERDNSGLQERSKDKAKV